jgi:hypothetical protein
MKAKAFSIRAPLLALVLASWLAWPTAGYATGLEQAASRPSTRSIAKSTVDVLVVPEDDARLIPPAAALAGRLSGPGHLPALLVSTGSVPQPEADLFLRQLKPQRCLVLKMTEARTPVGEAKKIDATVIELGQSLTQASLEIAERFWPTTEEVVVAWAMDPSAVILASALAGHMRVPLVTAEDGLDGKVIKPRLAKMKVRRLLAVTARGPAGTGWLEGLPQQREVLDVRQAAERLVRTIGPQQVRNIIVVRAPNAETLPSASGPLAAYLSIARRAPIVVCQSAEGRQVESDVLAFIKTHGLKPETITLLGDDQAIGLISLSDPRTLGEYAVEIEPCSGPVGGGAVAYGVGRIPQTSLRDASLLIARGVTRAQIVGRRRPRLLMIANPQTEYGVLPFAETVSRVTAQEFWNLRFPVDEFYGKPADSPEIVRASAKAHLIVFEGHVTDQVLFQDPTPPRPLPEEDIPVAAGNTGTDLIDSAEDEPARQAAPASGEGPPAEPGLQPPGVSAMPEEDPIQPQAQGDAGQPAPDVVPAPPSHLDGLPLVILQSCHSLDQIVAGKVFGQGGVALLGTVTNVHSASGSSFVKAYCDGMLYRSQTVGEALRDARNYFLCLARLKAQRGHKEQAKAYRAAMSFRLWGDPEVTVLPNTPVRARLMPVSAKFVAVDRVQITTPARFLPECRTSKYIARMFPGSQAAGIVKRVKGKEQRRLMPTYFFVLPAPEGFADGKHAKFQGEGDAAQRAVFMIHPAGRNVCLLYFPEKDKRRGEITLQFVK